MTTKFEIKDIEDRLVGLVDFAKKRYNEGATDYMPMAEIIGVDDKGERQAMVVGLGDEGAQEKRFEVLFNIGKAIALNNFPKPDVKITPLVVLFSSEAWISKYGKGVDTSKVPLPSKDPNRQEVFIVSAQTADGVDYFQSFDIKRGDKIELIGEMKFQDWKGGENRLLAEFWKGYYSIVKKA